MARILFVSNSSNPGGMEKHVKDLVVGMRKKRHEVFVWCPSGVMADVYENEGAKVIRLAIQFDVDPFYIVTLFYFLIREHIDIVHAHELKAVVNSHLAAFLARVKVRISHSHTPISTWKKAFLGSKLTCFFYSTFVNMFSTRELALTEQIRKIKIKEGIKAEKLIVIPNGIDTKKYDIPKTVREGYKNEIKSRYGVPRDAFVLGNLSRLSIEKGYDTLIEAFSLLKDPSSYLFIGGGGVLEEVISGSAKKLGIYEQTIITGLFEEEDKVKFLSCLDLLVFPSQTEGFGYLPLEGLCFGLPVIVSDIPALKEVCREYVTYFKKGNALDLTGKIREVKDKLGSFTFEEVVSFINKTYSLEVFWDSYNRLYENSLSNKI
ncbi:MAG: glycosyltransferase family 4 protein [Patescibacteria group bacterium]